MATPFRAGEFIVRGTPSARREVGKLSFAPAPVLQAAAGGLSNIRWSLAGLTPSSTVRRLSTLGRLGSARPVRHKISHDFLLQKAYLEPCGPAA
jgi:hypothetical protein